MSIFPYIYYMIQHFQITDDERQIAMYAGMVTSAFAIAEFLASIFWGRLSDRVGRKPILITGLTGTGISMLIFGFSNNLAVAMFARAMGGILNGYVSRQCLVDYPRSLTLLLPEILEFCKPQWQR
jgi:MFS family permease